jgi:hypothetical protein
LIALCLSLFLNTGQTFEAKNNNDKIQTDVIVMDFAKAFDKVPPKDYFTH